LALKIAVGIATVGRPQILKVTLDLLARQSRRPDRIVVCPVSPADIEGIDPADFEATITWGNKGLTVQRNAILAQLRDFDVVVFFDDDFLPDEGYLREVERAFEADTNLVIATGVLLADGARSVGLSVAEGLAMLNSARMAASVATEPSVRMAAYGCNMAIRLAPVYEHDLRFDPNLPLYSWLEDWDFSGQIVKVTGGVIVGYSGMRGVHLGSKNGKQSGVRLGYSQVANPVYIARKGNLPKRRLYGLVRRNVLANLARCAMPEPHIDRLGRLRGNALALLDLVRGQCHPREVEKL
jgi:glycosyltransferase involved in cell wall biosynthesis